MIFLIDVQIDKMELNDYEEYIIHNTIIVFDT